MVAGLGTAVEAERVLEAAAAAALDRDREAPRPRRPAPAPSAREIFSAARSVSVTTVVSDCSMVAIAAVYLDGAGCWAVRDTCNTLDFSDLQLTVQASRPASVRADVDRRREAAGVQRLVAVRDLRVLRPRDPDNDDDRELRLRAAAASPRPRPHDPVRVRRLAGRAEEAALHRQLLPDRDALHPLRHRDRLPVPARRDPPPARAGSGSSSS